MNVGDYDQKVDDLLDALTSDPDVTDEELRDLLLDIAFRCTAAAGTINAKQVQS